MGTTERRGHGFESRGCQPRGARLSQHGGCIVLEPSQREWECRTVGSGSTQMATYQTVRKLTFPRLFINFSTAQGPGSPSWKILTHTLPSPLELAGARYATLDYVRKSLRYTDGSRTNRSFVRGLNDVIPAGIVV